LSVSFLEHLFSLPRQNCKGNVNVEYGVLQLLGDMERVLLLLNQSIVVLLHWRCGSDTYNVVDGGGDLVLPQE